MAVPISMSSLVFRLDAIKRVTGFRTWKMDYLYSDHYLAVDQTMGDHDFDYLKTVGMVGDGKDYCDIQCVSLEDICISLETCPWLTLGDKDYLVYMTGTDTRKYSEKEIGKNVSKNNFKKYLDISILKAKEYSEYSIQINKENSDNFNFKNKNYNYKQLVSILTKNNQFPSSLVINISSVELGITNFSITASPFKTKECNLCDINKLSSKDIQLIIDNTLVSSYERPYSYEENNSIEAPIGGLFKFDNTSIIIKENEEKLVLSSSSQLHILDDQGKIKFSHDIPYGSIITKNNQTLVKKGDILARWDPYTNPILAEKDGFADYVDLIDGISMKTVVDDSSEYSTGISTKVVIDWTQQTGKSNLRPQITLRDKDGEIINLSNGLKARYFMPINTILEVENGSVVKAGNKIAGVPRGNSIDIQYRYISDNLEKKYTYDYDNQSMILDYNGYKVGYKQIFSFKKSYTLDPYISFHDLDCLLEERQGNGLLWKKAYYKYGKLDGLCEEFHENGNLWIKSIYDSGRLIFHEEYNANGQIEFKGSFKDNKNGVKEGLWKTFHDDFDLHSKGKYSNGNKDGIWEYYRRDGSLIKTDRWTNGVLDSSKKFYPNGQKKFDGIFKDGIERNRDGLWIAYFDNGNVFQKGQYESRGMYNSKVPRSPKNRGVRTGVWEQFKIDGSIEFSSNYIKGREEE